MAARTVFLDRILTGALLVGIAGVSNAIIMRHVNGSVDLTEYQENTLSPGTVNIVKKLPDRARIRAYFSKEFPPEGAAYFERIKDLLTQIERVSDGKVSIDWLDPNKADIAIEARKSGIMPREFPIPRNDRYEQVSIYLGLDIRCADRSPKILPFVALDNPEYEIARALAALSEEKPTVIGFYTREPAAPPQVPGFEMPPSPDRIFHGFREQLKQRFKVVDIETLKFGDPVSDEISVLVLGRPGALDERERFELDQYIMNGGRVLILLDDHENDIRGQKQYKKIDPGLEPLLTKWGVRVPDNLLVIDQACAQLQVRMQTLNGMQPRIVNYPYWLTISPQTNGVSTDNPITKRLQNLTLYWASPIELLPDRPQSLQIETLLQSSELAYRTKEVENIMIDDDLRRRVTMGIDAKQPSQQKLAIALVGKFPSVYAGKTPPAPAESRPASMAKPALDDSKRTVLAESKETRIVLVGDSDFATNSLLDQSSWIFLENSIEWLSLSQDLTSIRARNQLRKIRNFEQEELKKLGALDDKDTTLTVSSADDLQKKLNDLYEKNERSTLEARDAADARRTRIKLFNTLGPAAALIIFGFVRMIQRRQERKRLSQSA